MQTVKNESKKAASEGEQTRPSEEGGRGHYWGGKCNRREGKRPLLEELAPWRSIGIVDSMPKPICGEGG